MIPKTIHFCWFGRTEKSDEILRCIESWKICCPDFEIKEWNEDTFDITKYPFIQRMYNDKKWAFVVDHVRLILLEEYGGFYLDTDMLLLQSLSCFTKNSCVLGEEAPGIISAGMIGAEPHDPFIRACKKIYDDNPVELITIPRVLTHVFETYEHKNVLTICPPHVFYPFDSDHIRNYHGQDLGEEVIGVHLWNYSWGHPLNKFFKKTGIYYFGKKCAEILGVKKILKRFFGFI